MLIAIWIVWEANVDPRKAVAFEQSVPFVETQKGRTCPTIVDAYPSKRLVNEGESLLIMKSYPTTTQEECQI